MLILSLTFGKLKENGFKTDHLFVPTSLCIQGAQEVSCVVDAKSGDIVLSFESCQMNEGSQFSWKKDYKEITDFSKGVVIKTEGSV